MDKRNAVTFTVKDRHKSVAVRARCIVLSAVLVLVNLPATALPASACPGIRIEILDIRNSTGTIGCALFESPDGFPFEYLRFATHINALKIQRSQARCDFVDIPPGTYAVAVIHDENMNGKLDTNWLEVPTEGYGFSNNAQPALGPPEFSAAEFPYEGQDMALTIHLDY
ncbi:MAG: DUF2141 domain-containing protein [Desulfobacteraceae bacterium]|nr:MAG: DUF2141 domain-containing protein [Desulfobacteraceae bacterium]